MPPGLVKRRGGELLALVAAADIPLPAPPLPRRSRPDPRQDCAGQEPRRRQADVAASCIWRRRCSPRAATSNSWPMASATRRCCTAGAARCSASACSRRSEARGQRRRRLAARLRLAAGGRRDVVTALAFGGSAFVAGRAAYALARDSWRCRGRGWRACAPGAWRALRLGRGALRRRRRAERVGQAPCHGIQIALGIDDAQQSLRAVVIDQRPGLLVVDLSRSATVASLSSGRCIKLVRLPGLRAASRRRRPGEVSTLNTCAAVRRRCGARRCAGQLAVVDVELHHGIERLPSCLEHVGRAPRACARLRGKPSRMKPLRASGSRQPLADHAEHESSRPPACRRPSPPWPAGPAACRSPRRRAADRRWRSAECRTRCTRRCDWVPLPEPGAPNRTMRMFCSTSPLPLAARKARHVTGRSRRGQTPAGAPAHGSARALFFRAPPKPAGRAAHEKATPEERVLCPVRRRHPPSSMPRPAGSSRRRCASQAHRQGVRRAARHRRRAHRGPHRHQPREPAPPSAACAHARRRLRLGALQAQGPRQEPRRVRAPDRSVPRARHRLFLLQRRQRFAWTPRSRCPRSASSWAIPSPASACRRPWTTTCRTPTAARASARWPNTSRSPRARRRWMSPRWRAPPPRCSCSR